MTAARGSSMHAAREAGRTPSGAAPPCAGGARAAALCPSRSKSAIAPGEPSQSSVERRTAARAVPELCVGTTLILSVEVLEEASHLKCIDTNRKCSDTHLKCNDPNLKCNDTNLKCVCRFSSCNMDQLAQVPSTFRSWSVLRPNQTAAAKVPKAVLAMRTPWKGYCGITTDGPSDCMHGTSGSWSWARRTAEACNGEGTRLGE